MAKAIKGHVVNVPQISRERVRKLWEEGYSQTNKVLSTESNFKNYVILALVINLILILASFLLRPWLPPQIPLFYGLPEGEGQLASNWLLALPSLISILFIITNLIIGSFLENKFLRRTLILGALLTTVFSSITTVKILFLVGAF